MRITPTEPQTEQTKDLISVTSTSQFTGVACDAETVLLSLASINALEIEEDESMTDEDNPERSPIVIAIVIDKSGSMAGKKMDATKTTMHFIIKELTKKDKLAIVEYDTNVTTSLPLTLMDAAGKEKATAVTNAIKAGSATNLSGGLLAGLRLIPSDIDSKVVASTLLLTDGLANSGIRTANGIISMIQQTQSEGVGRCTINTFGFGADHDAKMLKQIADKGEGMYYFIETEDSVATAFADCLGGLLSVSAQGIELVIETADGVTLKQVHTAKQQEHLVPGKKVRISLGDLQEGESRDIPFEVTLPVCTVTESYPIATVTFSYFDQKAEQMKTLSSEVIVARPKAENLTDEQKAPNVDVVRHWNRISVARATEDAVQLADANKMEAARERLQSALNDLQTSPAVNEELTANLMQQVQTNLSGLSSRVNYQQKAKYNMNCFAKAVNEQRCYVSSEAPTLSSNLAPSPSSAAQSAAPVMWSTNKRAAMKSKFSKK